MCNRKTIQGFCQKVLKKENEELSIVMDNYSEHFLSIDINDRIDENKDALEMHLFSICNVLFTLRNPTTPYVLAMLSYCMKLDKHYTTSKCVWYDLDLLLELVTDILVKFEWCPTSQFCSKQNWRCVLI